MVPKHPTPGMRARIRTCGVITRQVTPLTIHGPCIEAPEPPAQRTSGS